MGCRINKEPFLTFEEALRVGKRQEKLVRASGKWVEVEDVKEPEVKRPENGIWSFRDLSRFSEKPESRTDTALQEDLRRTLESYSKGWAIIGKVVIGIIQNLDPSPQARYDLMEVAKSGLQAQRRDREKPE